MHSTTTVADAVLPLHLFGPLQAWGGAGAMHLRMSVDFPTKSGLIGVMGAAMGRARGSDNSDLAACRYAVRLDRKGDRMVDFHTVRKKNKTEDRDGPCKGIHTPKDESMLTYREYLVWYGFTAFVEGPRDLLEKVHTALQTPRWDLSLGRRNCQPAVHIGQSPVLDMSTDEALHNYWVGSYIDSETEHVVWRDARPGETWVSVPDEPVGYQRFRSRAVTRLIVKQPKSD